MSKKNIRAFTMTEIAIVLGVVGIILGGVWLAASSVMKSSREKQAAQDILTMANNMRSTFMATNNFSSASQTDQTTAMITAGIIPSTLVQSATSAVNAWRGAVRIYHTAGGNNRRFRISYFNTPRDACMGIATVIANLGTSDAPVTLTTNTSSSTPIPNTPPTVGLSVAAIQTECQRNMSGTNVTATASTEFDFVIH